MSGKLPELKRGDTDRFLERFAPDRRVKGVKVTGLSVHGHPFSIDLDHKGGMRPDILGHALRYMGVSRDEFWAWYEGQEPKGSGVGTE